MRCTSWCPRDIDDPASPSGGNGYDRRVVQGLAATGWDVRERAVPGGWPRPDAAARAGLARALAALPDGAVVLVDGLVACGVPEVVVPAARRLALVVLVHLPLGDEAGGAPGAGGARAGGAAAAAAVVATSPWAARRLVALHGLDPARVTVAAPGVDPAPLAPGTDGASTCCASVRSPRRRARTCWSRRSPRSPTCRGPASSSARWPRPRARRRGSAARSRATGSTGACALTGPQTGAALDAAYAAADLLVVPSRAETYGMVVTEALARGIPVLATRRGRAAGDARPRPGRPRAGDGRPGRATLRRSAQRCAAGWSDPLLRNGLRRGAPSGVEACCTDGR